MIISTLEEFCKYFSVGKSIISLDYGAKKIGMAISSPDHKMSLPFKMIINDEKNTSINEILTIITNKEICAIVIGLPLNMDGSPSSQTSVAINFAEKIAAKTMVPIFMQDERLTSKAADSLLKSFGLTRKQRNNNDDLIAASLILETTLEASKRL